METNEDSKNEKQDSPVFNHEEVFPLIKNLIQALKINLKIANVFKEEAAELPADAISLLQFGMFGCMRQYLSLANKVAEVTGKMKLRADGQGMTVQEVYDMFGGLVKFEEENEESDEDNDDEPDGSESDSEEADE